MAYVSKTWLPRIVEYAGRRRLDGTGTPDVYDVSRQEGTVIQEGDGFTVDNMNGMETRIEDGLNEKVDLISVVNNGTTTEAGYVLDARYGKTLVDEQTRIHDELLRGNAVYQTRVTVTYINGNALGAVVGLPPGVFYSTTYLSAVASHEWNSGNIGAGYSFVTHITTTSTTSVSITLSDAVQGNTFNSSSVATVNLIVVGQKA